MKKLKVAFLVCVLACIASCFGNCFCDDCTYNEEKLPTYANKSGETIKIITIIENYPKGEKFIVNGDTLHNYSIEERRVFCPGGYDLPFCRSNIRVELYFDDSQKCLIFDGPIKNDGIDMRSWDSYKRGKKIDNWADFWVGEEYVYIITPEHKAMAKEEDCPIDTP